MLLMQSDKVGFISWKIGIAHSFYVPSNWAKFSKDLLTTMLKIFSPQMEKQMKILETWIVLCFQVILLICRLKNSSISSKTFFLLLCRKRIFIWLIAFQNNETFYSHPPTMTFFHGNEFWPQCNIFSWKVKDAALIQQT